MSTISELLGIALYVLVGLFFVGVLSIMAFSACALFGFLPFESATAKARVVRKNLLRIWLAILGLVLLWMLLSVMFGQK